MGADTISSDTSDELWPSPEWPGPDTLHRHIDDFLGNRGISPALEALGRSTGALAKARTLAPGTGLVVTGQQPAVGGGPLYTLVKIAHAIALAEGLSRPQHPLIPYFWCASEDHDTGEADHADVITHSGDIRRFHADLGPGRAALRHRLALPWWEGLISHSRTHLGPGIGEDFLKRLVPKDTEGIGAWQVRLLSELFRDYGLWCMEGHLLRPLWRDGMERAIRDWPAGALETLRQRLTSSGLSDPFGALSQAPLFADRVTGRSALSSAEAAQLAISDPDVLSPGAAVRPILQQVALPAPFYVAGPGEFHYHRFLAPLYAAVGAPRPHLVARCSLSLVPGWVERGVHAWGRRIDDCATPSLASASSPAQASPAEHTRPTDAVVQDLDDALQRMRETSHRLPPDWQSRVAGSLTRLARERDRLQASLRRGERQRAGLPAWGALCAYEFPHGQRQERTMSLFQALWLHGPGLVHALVARARSSRPGEHHFLMIDGPSSHAR